MYREIQNYRITNLKKTDNYSVPNTINWECTVYKGVKRVGVAKSDNGKITHNINNKEVALIVSTIKNRNKIIVGGFSQPWKIELFFLALIENYQDIKKIKELSASKKSIVVKLNGKDSFSIFNIEDNAINRRKIFRKFIVSQFSDKFLNDIKEINQSTN
jgi:hypothetical protein